MSDDRHRILVVEDDEFDRLSIERALQKVQLPVYTSTVDSARAALSALDDGHFDVVIVDFNLPDLDAAQMLLEIRPDKAESLGIICVASHGDIREATRVLQNGAHDYIIKDEISGSRLELAIKSALRTVELTAALERQRRELIRSNKELEQYALLASHDLRQPLRAIRGYLELLEYKQGQIDEDGQRYLSKAREAAVVMSGYIDGLLAVARLNHEPGAHSLFSTETAISNVLSGIYELGEPGFAEISFSELPSQFGVSEHFQRVMHNLISNSLAHSKGISRRLEIEVTARFQRPIAVKTPGGDSRRLGLWLWVVSDNGPGLATADTEALFKMFSTGRTGTSAGRGIGLAICRKIVEGYGGEITLNESVEQGCSVTFSWPGPLPKDSN